MFCMFETPSLRSKCATRRDEAHTTLSHSSTVDGMHKISAILTANLNPEGCPSRQFSHHLRLRLSAISPRVCEAYIAVCTSSPPSRPQNKASPSNALSSVWSSIYLRFGSVISSTSDFFGHFLSSCPCPLLLHHCLSGNRPSPFSSRKGWSCDSVCPLPRSRHPTSSPSRTSHPPANPRPPCTSARSARRSSTQCQSHNHTQTQTSTTSASMLGPPRNPLPQIPRPALAGRA